MGLCVSLSRVRRVCGKENVIFMRIILIILIIILAAVVSAGAVTMFIKKNKANYEIVGIKDFSCEGITGFSFRYPVFKNWEIKGTQLDKYVFPNYKGKGEICSIWFNWPDDIEFEVPPRTIIEKRIDLSLNQISEANKKNLKTNPNGVSYDFVFDPENYVEGYKPKPGQWDYLQFYGPDFGVKIWPFRGTPEDKYGFSLDVFIEEIIKSFKFDTNI